MGKFQDTTVKKIIGQLNDSFFLPDIQREYVWLNKEQDKKIELLFDSILRDYPIGTFLFWSLKKSDFETSKDAASAAGKLNFQLYKFIERYDVRKSHNEKVNIEQVKSENITIVLDGQQRLTSLYIGLMGSRTLKKPRYWWDNPDAFEEKKLYLNLRHAPQPDNPDDNYQFEFKAPSSLPTPDEKNYWFRVGEILELDSVLGYSRQHGLSDEESILLEKLHNNLCSKDIISFYNEDEKNLDKVLKIFIRVNSGGTQLSYSDLLMSILTANFSSDIRTLMIELVDNLQNSGFGVMGRDQILKTCLLLTGCNHVFKLENFSKTNISKIENNWSRITECILDAASIAEDFGYANNLSSGYILTTIALYLYIKNLRAGKVSVDDRREIWKFIRNAQITAYFSATLDSKLGIAANTMRGNKDLPQVNSFGEFNVRMDKDRNISVHKENVLDMLNFDLDKFSTLIKDSLNGYNQLVCVGPYFRLSYKDNRMIQFHLLIGGKVEYRKILDKYELDSERAWTVQVLCFSIGNLMTEKLSTDVMAEDLKDAVVDEHGVLYSKDGRRLLKCSDNHPETYNIKDGTKVICNNAFSELWNRGVLKQVTIPNSVAIIGNDAFRCCESLRKITIPSSLTMIGDNPFVGCDIVDFENHSKLFTTTDQMLIEIKENRLIAYFGKEKSIIIPDSIKCIGGSAFGNCHLLRKIIIPDSVDIICQRAFARCRSLQNIAIPSSVKSIGRWAFDCCDSLKTISITNSVERIGHGAFHGCSSLLRINIPESVTAIPAEVFEGCESLQYVLIPKSVTSIGVGAFAGCNSLIQIHLPNSVKRIEDEAFDDCESLQQIVIPKESIEKFKEMLDEDLWDKLVEE